MTCDTQSLFNGQEFYLLGAVTFLLDKGSRISYTARSSTWPVMCHHNLMDNICYGCPPPSTCQVLETHFTCAAKDASYQACCWCPHPISSRKRQHIPSCWCILIYLCSYRCLDWYVQVQVQGWFISLVTVFSAHNLQLMRQVCMTKDLKHLLYCHSNTLGMGVAVVQFSQHPSGSPA